MSAGALSALALSGQVAFWAPAAILPPGILLGWLLARHEVRGKALIETLTS